MAPPLARVSTVDALVAAIRAQVLDGPLEPGQRLNEVALSAAFGVGRHTLRAALVTLVGDGLLRRAPNRGVYVPVVEAADLDDLHRYRRALELAALEAALERGDGFAAVASAVARLARARDEGAPWPALTAAHNAIHVALVEASASPRLIAAHRAIEAELALYVRQLRPAYPADRLVALHRSLAAALASGDPVRAREALARDLDRGHEALVAALRGSCSPR